MNNKGQHKIDGEERESILNSTTNFIELKSGETINKAYIVEILKRGSGYTFEKIKDYGQME